MSWVKLDDRFFRHPKVIEAGRDARDLYLVALCSCAEDLTDGFVSERKLRLLAAEAEVDDPAKCAAKLASVGLWEVVPGGWVVHDYHEYQPSRDKAQSVRKARSEAGSRGAAKTNAAKDAANTAANTTAKSRQTVQQNDGKTNAPSPSPERVSSLRSDTPPNPPSGGTAAQEGRGNAVALFIDGFREKFEGEDPDLQPKHMKGLKETEQRLGRDKFTKAVSGFFADPWPSESGYSVALFLSQPAERWTHSISKQPARASPGRSLQPQPATDPYAHLRNKPDASQNNNSPSPPKAEAV